MKLHAISRLIYMVAKLSIEMNALLQGGEGISHNTECSALQEQTEERSHGLRPHIYHRTYDMSRCVTSLLLNRLPIRVINFTDLLSF